MKITKRHLRRIIKETLGQGGLDVPVRTDGRIHVEWDDDGENNPKKMLHPDTVRDWNIIAASDGVDAANEAVTEMLTDETGYLIIGWEWVV